MAQPKHLQALSAATLRILRPLVRLLLRNNVAHRSFVEFATSVYGEVANAEFGIAGKKQMTSGIAILSGLTRREVQRLLAQTPGTEPVTEEEYHRASRVITGWVRDPETVDFQNADLSAMPNPAPNTWNGRLVDVRGSQVSSGGSGPYGVRMTATKIKPEGLGTEDREGAEIQGFVTQVVALGDFYLGNVHVQTSAGTTFEGGTLNDILVGAHLEVHGSLVGGIVSATKVEFEGETELQANVATINSSDNTVTLTGLAGLIVQFDSHTRLDGQGSPRRLDDLHSGDHLSIHGRMRGGKVILATEVERSDPKSNVQLQGLVTSAANPILVLLGASIDTSSIPESGFLGRYGVIERSAFFSGLSSGKKVSVQGNVVTTTVDWTSATRKD